MKIDITSQFEEFLSHKLSILSKYTIWIGVIDGQSKLDRDEYTKAVKDGQVYYKKKKKDSSGEEKKSYNNAQILNALSNGWDIETKGGKIVHVPARPILDIAIKEAKKKLIPDFYNTCIEGVLDKRWNDDDLFKQMNILGDRIANLARDIIYDNNGILEANAPSTIKQKGFDHPLFKTSQLAKAITYCVVED